MSKILPILFNTKMVQAILDERKTCTRRLVKPQPTAHYGTLCIKSPYQPGDILYVRETWTKESGKYYFRADYGSDYLDACETLSGGYPASCRNYAGCEGCTATSTRIHWHPSIHMPKEAARIWLKVTDVRVERLQDMDWKDALREGINTQFAQDKYGVYIFDENPLDDFVELWNSTIKKSDLDRYGWDANPWVWVIQFEQCEKLNW